MDSQSSETESNALPATCYTPNRGSRRPKRKPGSQISAHEFILCVGGFWSNSISTIIHQKWMPDFVAKMQKLLNDINEAINLLTHYRSVVNEKAGQRSNHPSQATSSSTNNSAASRIIEPSVPSQPIQTNQSQQHCTPKKKRNACDASFDNTNSSDTDSGANTPSRTLGSPIDAKAFLLCIGGFIVHIIGLGDKLAGDSNISRIIISTIDAVISQLEALRCNVNKAIEEANHVPSPSNATADQSICASPA